jgi:hypothetical protein
MMRKRNLFLRLSIAILFSVALLLVLSQKFFPGFVTSGQSGLAAPIEVEASDGAYATKTEISWVPVRGATAYRVFRNTSNNSASAVSLGTTAAGSFPDTTGVAAQNYFYWVRAENGNTISSLSDPDQGVRANGIINGPVPPLNPPPEPAGNQVTASKAYLGKALFWDEQLSSTRTVRAGRATLPPAAVRTRARSSTTCGRPIRGPTDYSIPRMTSTLLPVWSATIVTVHSVGQRYTAFASR